MSLSLSTLPIVQAECVNEHNSETPHIKYCLLLKAMETFMCHWLFKRYTVVGATNSHGADSRNEITWCE